MTSNAVSIGPEPITELARLMVESVGDYAIFALDPTGHIVTWNTGAQRIKGYTGAEVIGRHFSLFYREHERLAGKPDAELVIAAAEGRFEEDGWRVRKGDEEFWANVVITALRREGGELAGFVKVSRDLSERRAAEQALRESEQRFRLLVESVRDYGIFMLDAGGHVASWNRGAADIKGYAADEIIGRHFSTFYPAADVAVGKPDWELVVAARDGRFEDEGWRVRKDGSQFWANVVITALRNPAGELVGFTKVTRDLTERRAAESRALEDARRLAAADAANQARSQFLAAMSHELRTPLNAINGYAELIALGLVGPVNEQQQEFLSRIRDSQQRLLGIVNDLLKYSRIEDGTIAYDIGTVSLPALLAAMLPLIAPLAERKGVAFDSCPAGDPLFARADRVKTEQLLLNILFNAVKFTPPGGRIAIECSATADRVAVSIRDTGPGIPLEQHEAIFEPFVQVGRSYSSTHEGAGLGLAISRDLVRAMGGDITVTSAPGEGSTFTVYLPRSDSAPLDAPVDNSLDARGP